MTLTLSPETEADIRELLRLWGWDAGDPLLAEATARAAMVNGLRSAIAMTRELAGGRHQAAYRKALDDALLDTERQIAALRVDCNWDVQRIPQPLPGGVLVWRDGSWCPQEEGGAK